jgi:hypothetical protein
MDVFKAMGITVGNDIKMIDQIESKTVAKSDESVQIVRKGSDISARERLEGQIEKGFVMSRAPQYAPGHEGKTDYAGGLKNTHGENWHTDNDKQVEEFLSAAEPVDREFPAESKANTKTPRHPATYAPTGEQSHQLEFKSLSQEELFLKAFDEVDQVVSKGKKKKFDFDKDGKIDEHEEHHAEMEEEVEEAEKACKKSDLDDIFDLVKAQFPRKGTSKRAPAQPKDPVQQKQERQQKKELLGKWAKKSEKDERDNGSLATIAPDPYAGNPELIANVHENSPDVTERLRPAPLQKGSKFIKASGPGGLLFDFGGTTGNPIADRATALLNAHSDPIQASNANYNATSYQKALTDFVNKGDAAYAQQTTMFGNIDKEWSNQLNKPMDQQVKEAFQKGELDNADPSAPAIKNDFNKTELNLGGQVIKATSETDAAIIEMMKAQDMSMPGDGMIADATSGGRVSITAGEPLPQV